MKIQQVRLSTGATMKAMINLKNVKLLVLTLQRMKLHETLADSRKIICSFPLGTSQNPQKLFYMQYHHKTMHIHEKLHLCEYHGPTKTHRKQIFWNLSR